MIKAANEIPGIKLLIPFEQKKENVLYFYGIQKKKIFYAKLIRKILLISIVLKSISGTECFC